MTLHPPNVTFHDRVEHALADTQLHVALERATGRFTTLRADALASLPEAEAVRDRARQIRAHTSSKLDTYLNHQLKRRRAAALGRWRGGTAHSHTCRRVKKAVGAPMVSARRTNHSLQAAGTK